MIELEAAIRDVGYTFYQPLLRSSYSGYGYSSIETDVEDLASFLDHIRDEYGVSRVTLMGHSTGCQDIVEYMHRSANKGFIDRVILQAPVSDREAFDALLQKDPTLVDSFKKSCLLASSALPGTFLPKEVRNLIRDGDPLTCERFKSLAGRETIDDCFSSDAESDYLIERFSGVTCPALLIFSQQDEYYPEYVQVDQLAAELVGSFPNGQSAIIDGDHALSDCTKELIGNVLRFVT